MALQINKRNSVAMIEIFVEFVNNYSQAKKKYKGQLYLRYLNQLGFYSCLFEKEEIYLLTCAIEEFIEEYHQAFFWNKSSSSIKSIYKFILKIKPE